MSGVSVNVRDAVNAINALRSTQIPAFRKELMSQLALEALKIMTPLTPIDSGDLRRSETIDRIGEDEYEVGPHIFYAKYVFCGTDKMAARPVHHWTYFELVSRAPVIAGAIARKMVVFP